MVTLVEASTPSSVRSSQLSGLAPAGQLAGLLHPSGELSFVELIVLMDVEVAHFLVLDLPEGRGRSDVPDNVPAGTLALVRSLLVLRCSSEQNALHTLIHQRHLTPSCGGHAPTAERTLHPARMLTESLTPRPELENDQGRVEMWRGGFRPNISVAASFVWRCLSGSAMTPFPHPAHR